MILWQAVLLILVGFAAGILNVLAGGGSLLTLPVLLFLGLPAATANGTNRVAILLQNIMATHSFRRSGHLDTTLVVWCATSALAGSLLGAHLAVDVGEVLFRRILAGVIVMVCVVMVLDPARRLETVPRALTLRRKAALAVTFLAVGVYGGFIQAGVGFLIIAGLMVHGLDLVRINAVKVVVVGLFTVGALAVFVYHGQVDWALGLALGAGNTAGGLVGARLTVLRGHTWVRRVVLVAALIFALRLVWQGF